MTSGCLLIRGTPHHQVPQVNERGSPFRSSDPRARQRNFWETLLPRLNSACKSRNTAKVKGVRKGRNQGPKTFRYPGELQTRLHAGTAPPAVETPVHGRAGDPAFAAGPREAEHTRPNESLETHLRVDTATTYPVFLAPGGDRKPLFISSYRIHGGSFRGKGLNVPARLHPKGLPTQKASPLVVGVGPQVEIS